jgi:hypothetical protein
MSRKLHNTVTALIATSGLLVLSLMAARPVSQDVVLPMGPATVEAAQPAETDLARLEASQAELEAEFAKAESEFANVVVAAAEVATAAAVAAAFEQARVAEAGRTAKVTPRKRVAHGRQSVAMPFFSFAPRG